MSFPPARLTRMLFNHQVQDVEIELKDPKWTIFMAVQELIQMADLGSRQEKLRRIWEPTYT